MQYDPFQYPRDFRPLINDDICQQGDIFIFNLLILKSNRQKKLDQLIVKEIEAGYVLLGKASEMV